MNAFDTTDSKPASRKTGAPRHFIELDDVPAADLRRIIDEARRRKELRAGLPKGARDDDAPELDAPLEGHVLAMLFEKPELCLHALLQGRAAACGVELYQIPFLHYAGNFWWTTCRRVRKLAEPDSMLPMTASTWGLPENWIGSVGDDSMLSLFNAYWSNPYATDLERQHYMPVAELLPCVACPGCDPSPLA